jgi:hypothetical protein
MIPENAAEILYETRMRNAQDEIERLEAIPKDDRTPAERAALHKAKIRRGHLDFCRERRLADEREEEHDEGEVRGHMPVSMSRNRKSAEGAGTLRPFLPSKTPDTP